MAQGTERRANPRRDARKQAAEKHVKQVAERFGKEIERAAAGMRRVEGTPNVAPADTCLPAVTVTVEDSVAAILANGRGYAQFCDLAVLDFASFVNPGGGYIRGTWGQEQALCAESFLYNVLEQAGDWYAENRRRNINCELYRDRALVVPAVRFDRDRMHAYADVVVAAAPNAARARRDYHVKDNALAASLRSRVRFALALIDELGREKAVLGAWGCGAFGWDPEEVAAAFREELASGTHGLKQVIFAVPETRYDENHAVFAHAFSAFPDEPAESYAAVAAERKAAAQAAERAREAEAAEEEDDDWRKYL